MQGRALCIGLNDVDRNYYGDTFKPLDGAERDAIEMASLAEKYGFATPDLLLGANATWGNVTAAIETAAGRLQPGDIFLLSFAGHGSEISAGWLADLDSLPRSVEPGEAVQTWLLWDKEIMDKELRTIWTKFDHVRLLIVLDSCHSFSAWDVLLRKSRGPLDAQTPPPKLRLFPPSAQNGVLDRDREDYASRLDAALPRSDAKDRTTARILSLTACQDNQLARDGDPNGLFTEVLLSALVRAWQDYRTLHSAVEQSVLQRNPDQKPGLYPPEGSFAREQPFSIPEGH